MASDPSNQTAPGARTGFITHKGCEILCYDFAGIQDTDVGFQVVEAAKPKILGRPPKSVRTLVTVHGSRFDARIARALQDLAHHNKPYVIASAIVGLSGLQRVILNAVMRVTGRKFGTFEDVDAAKDWLVSQEKPSLPQL